MIFHENRLPADDSHEISCLICYFRKKNSKTVNCRLLQIIATLAELKEKCNYYILYGRMMLKYYATVEIIYLSYLLELVIILLL